MRPPTPRALAAASLCVAATLPVWAVVPGASARPDPAPARAQVADGGTVTYADPQVDGVREVEGTLVEYVVESPSRIADASTEDYAVETGSGRLVPVEVRGELPAQVAGAAVTAEVGATGALASAEIDPVAARAAGGAATAHRAYVAKVTNQGAYSDADPVIADTLDTALRRWVAETDGRISSFTRVGGFSDYQPTGGCGDAANLWDQAARQAFPRVDFGRGTGNHLVVLAPEGCVFGVAQVGRDLTDGGRLVVSYDRGSYLGALMHEIGHNLGLGHAHSRVCTTSGCSTADYGNFYDFMGVTWSGAQPTGLDSAQRAQLGVTGSCETPAVTLPAGQRTVTATYDVLGRGTDVGTRGLAVTDPTTGTRYSLDWRNRAGRDTGGFYGSDYARGTYAGQVNGYGPGLTVQEVRGRDVTLLPSTEATPRGGRAYSRDPGEGFSVGGMRVEVDSAEGAGTGQSAQVSVTLTDPSVAPGPALPRQTGAVAVAGTPGPGATLSAVTTGWTAGTCWRYRWFADGVAIPGARQRTYDVTDDDTDRQLTVEVVGQASGFAPRTASSATADQTDPADPTDPTGPVAPTAFTSSPAPRVTGTPRVGRTLRASVGSWSPSPTRWTYRWSAGRRPIVGATRPAFRVTGATRGKRLTVTVTASRGGYDTVSRTSRATAPVRR